MVINGGFLKARVAFDKIQNVLNEDCYRSLLVVSQCYPCLTQSWGKYDYNLQPVFCLKGIKISQINDYHLPNHFLLLKSTKNGTRCVEKNLTTMMKSSRRFRPIYFDDINKLLYDRTEKNVLDLKEYIIERKNRLVNKIIKKMHYIIVTEFESPEESTCKIMGLPMIDIHNLLLQLVSNNIPCNNLSKSIEADASGDRILNLLCGPDFNYSVVSQSMAIETTAIGGRTVKVQKLAWTMVNTKM